MKDIIGTLIIMLLCITALAKSNQPEDTQFLFKPDTKQKPKAKPVKTEKRQDKAAVKFSGIQPLSLQVLMGSQGVGADIKYGFFPKLSGRLGLGLIPVGASKGFSFTGFPVQGQLSARFTNVHLLGDYSPFKSNFFRIVGGAGYFIHGNADVLVSPSNGYQIGSRSLTKDQIGTINADVIWKGLAPYLGVAIFRDFPKRLFNMNLDVGTYYLSRPATSFTGTKLLSDNDANAKQFNENMQGYRWLPVIQLNFNFRIK